MWMFPLDVGERKEKKEKEKMSLWLGGN